MRRAGALIALWLLAVILAVALPWYQTWRAPLDRVVLRVGTEAFRLRDVAGQMGPGVDGLAVLERLAANRLVLAEARRRDLVPGPDELRTAVLRQVGETSTGLDDADLRLAAAARRAGLDVPDLLSRMEIQAARARLGAVLAGVDDTGAEMVQVWAAVTEQRQQAETLARAAIEAGSLPEAVHRLAVRGGPLGWVPRGADDSRAEPQWHLDCADGALWQSVHGLRDRDRSIVPDSLGPGDRVGACTVRDAIPGGLLIDDLAFAMPVGAISPPLLTEQGFVVLQVQARGQRDVPDVLRARLVDTALRRFTDAALAQARAAGEVELSWGSRDEAFLKLRRDLLPARLP